MSNRWNWKLLYENDMTAHFFGHDVINRNGIKEDLTVGCDNQNCNHVPSPSVLINLTITSISLDAAMSKDGSLIF